MADDDRIVIVETSTQTVESGGWLIDQDIQTDQDYLQFQNVITDNIVSFTELQSNSGNSGNNSEEEPSTTADEAILFSNSYTNTIVTFC